MISSRAQPRDRNLFCWRGASSPASPRPLPSRDSGAISEPRRRGIATRRRRGLTGAAVAEHAATQRAPAAGPTARARQSTRLDALARKRASWARFPGPALRIRGAAKRGRAPAPPRSDCQPRSRRAFRGARERQAGAFEPKHNIPSSSPATWPSLPRRRPQGRRRGVDFEAICRPGSLL